MLRTLWPSVWRYGCGVMLLSLLASCAGRPSPPAARPSTSGSHIQYGTASWYGEPFHGRRTANGEVYNMHDVTAAHLTAPLGIQALVSNLENGRSVRVRINDRGPYIGNRVLDLSYGAARQLGMVEAGLARVRIEFLLATTPVQTFVVQAGAYTGRENALRAQKVLAMQYPQISIATVQEGSTTLYRVRLGTFANRSEAERVVRHVSSLGYMASIVPAPASENPTKRMDNRL